MSSERDVLPPCFISDGKIDVSRKGTAYFNKINAARLERPNRQARFG